ncbi:MAG: TRAP transporter small permease [Burkholderiales bacterium]|nr:TRAP transporter small permease [Burkholderiales bacterium]
MVVKWLERLEEGLLAFLLAVMTLIIFVQVVARYVFNYSFTWALESVTYLFAGLIFLGMAYGVRVGAHIGIDLLVKSLGPLGARIVGAIAAALCVLYSGIVLFGSVLYVEKIHSIGILAQDLPIKQWIPRLVLPIGFTLLGLRFVEIFFRIVTGREKGLHLANEAADALKMNLGDPTPPDEAGKP